MSKNFSAAVRLPKGAWQHRSYGPTAREAKRALARKADLPVRAVDGLPLGKSKISTKCGVTVQVIVEGGK